MTTIRPPLDLPERLVSTVRSEFGAQGEAFLRDLPQLLEDVTGEWSLTLERPYADLSYHFVAAARRADGTPAVLKLGVPHDEMRTEIEALRYFDGRGIARLLKADIDRGAILIERLEPGETLVALAEEDDDAATLVGAKCMRSLWRPSPGEANSHWFRDMQGWFREMWEVHDRLTHDGEPIPAILARGVSVARELIDSTEAAVVLHGDLHHMNILSAQRAPWLAIDPKGHSGDRCYEVYAFLTNPRILAPRQLSRRLDLLTGELAIDRTRTRDWCFAREVLNACWSFEDHSEFRKDLEIAEMLATI